MASYSTEGFDADLISEPKGNWEPMGVLQYWTLCARALVLCTTRGLLSSALVGVSECGNWEVLPEGHYDNQDD